VHVCRPSFPAVHGGGTFAGVHSRGTCCMCCWEPSIMSAHCLPGSSHCTPAIVPCLARSYIGFDTVATAAEEVGACSAPTAITSGVAPIHVQSCCCVQAHHL
jgi:hypothetical protein